MVWLTCVAFGMLVDYEYCLSMRGIEVAEASMSLSLTQDQCVIGIKRKGEDSLFISLNFKAHPIHSMAVRHATWAFFAPRSHLTDREKTRLFIGKAVSFHLLYWSIKTGWFDDSIVVVHEYVCAKYELKEVDGRISLYVCVCRVTGFLIAKTKKLMRSPRCNKNDKPAFNLISNSSLSFLFRTRFLPYHSTASHERNAMAYIIEKLRSNQRINTAVKTSTNTKCKHTEKRTLLISPEYG